ncbi:uncharacterized protein Dana_GF25200, isoform A [Drosophila ananassae]|uniref:Uncharacterized protein, isoform A n=2 Tax=Drosophila ananassae TaxID=7217 RepID=B3M3G7_DROAN|nr:uncharacterized protein LOC6507825 isoform X1 [Drosophila ananassae]EDV39228.1 uncharacterized protein Dana_GF25200, isoform A [Drosophila ananassae]
MSKGNADVLLLRAVAKQPALYDRTAENYRKRLPCENSWDIVASETGESVNNCKRQWRQMRNSYTRFVNLSAQRKRNGQRRLSYPLAEELKFLDPHLHLAEDDSRSESDRDKDSNRDSSSRDISLDQSLKASVITADKAPETPGISEDHKKDIPLTEKVVGEDQETRSGPAIEHSREEVSEKPVNVTESDTALNSETEAEVNVEENPEEELTGFGFESTLSFQEQQTVTSEKPSEGDSVESPRSQSEFFIKKNNDSHLLIIGKKRAPIAMGDSRDPLDESDDDLETIPSPSRRAGRRPLRASMSIKDMPIHRSELGQRLTRLQRRKSLSMAAFQRARSSTSPVKLSQVPRSSLPNKQGQVMVKTIASSRDDIFPRPEPMDKANAANAQQKRSVGRPKKPLQPMIQRMKELIAQRESPTPKSPGQSSMSVQQKSAMASKTNTSTPSNTSTSNTVTRKSPENITMVTFSPITPSSATGTPTGGQAGTVGTPLIAANSTSSPISVQPYKTLTKRCERSSQTESPSLNTDEQFLEMIKPQMMEMNPRQKMMFKKKVFQSLMETFDDATDFPEAGELQHFNINTPSGYEQVSDPELRLVRELVSLVSAAKVTPRQPSPREPSPSASITNGKPAAPDTTRQPRVVPRHMIQRVYKPGSAVEVTTPVMNGPGHEKKLFRILQMNGKPNGLVSASLEDLRAKDSAESGTSGSIKLVHPPVVSPRTSTIVAAVRPQGSSMNTLFGQHSAAAIKAAHPKLRMSRRYSVCGSGNPPPGPPIGPMPANAGALNSNLNPMEAAMLKRRLIAPTQGMVPPLQRPRYSTGGGGQLVASPNGNSLLVRKPVAGSVTGINKQLSPVGGSSVPTKTPQITNVQGSAFNDFVQPASKASTGPSASSSSGLGEASSAKAAIKRVVVGNKTVSAPTEQEPNSRQGRSDSTETAATIAADDFSLTSLKREPLDHMDDQDILGM